MQATGGATPLMYACQQCRENEVLDILSKQPHAVRERDRTLKTPLHYCAENPNSSCAEAVLKVAPELVSAQDENGYCPLHLAVIAGNKPLIKLLISKGADVNIHDNEGHSAVHWAIVSSEKEALEMIVRAGANPSTPDIHGGYPLHYAVQMCGCNCDFVRNFEDTVRVVETLLNFGVDVSVKDKDGRQPILWAASAGSADAVIHLVSAGACVEAADKDGLTALHCAASRGHTATLETLISLCGANVDVIDGNGCSALFYSVTLGHADATELLLQLGAEPNRQDRKGRTPAHCGAAKGQLETLRILKKHGGNLWMRNVKGDIPLHEAVASGRKDLVLWLLSQCSEAINIANNDGRCPLHIASMYNNTEMVKVLLDCKSLVNPVMRTSKGILMTPLNVALSKGHRSCGKYLQLHGGVPFSKVSKVEPGGGLALRVSPPDDAALVVAENNKENVVPSQIVISRSRSSTDVQENREIAKPESTDKKKVYRRRKKKKNSSNVHTQDSDSDDSTSDLKVKTPGSRKSEKSNENHVENNASEKVKNLRVEVDAKKKAPSPARRGEAKAEVPAKNDSPGRTEERVTKVTKAGSESKPLQRNKSFNETKNVSDLSPGDFPPQMQTINHLDIVIMEPDADASKPDTENEVKHRKSGAGHVSQEKPTTGMKEKEGSDFAGAEITPSDGLPNGNGESDVRVEEEGITADAETTKEKVSVEEKSGEASGVNKPNEGSSESGRKSSEGGSIGKSVKSPKSSSDGGSCKKSSKGGKITDGSSDGSGKRRKTPGPRDCKAPDRSGEKPSDAAAQDWEADKPVCSETKAVDETQQDEGPKAEAETVASEAVPEDRTVSNAESLAKEVAENILAEATEAVKNDESVASDLHSEIQKEGSPALPAETGTLPTETEEGKPSEREASAEGDGVAAEEEPPPLEATAPEANPSDARDFNGTAASEKKAADVMSPEERTEEHEKVPLSEVALVGSSSENENFRDGRNESAIAIQEPVKESLPHQAEKPSVEPGQATTEKPKEEEEEEEEEEKAEKATKHGGNSIGSNTGEEPMLSPREGDRTEERRKGEATREPREGSPRMKAEERQFRTPRVSRLCRRNREFKDDMNQGSVTQLVQNTVRKYHMERGIFYQLLELKRYQIRSGRANEQVLVKRLADEYERSRVFLGMKPFTGLYKFKEFEKFLYDQLKALNSRRSFIIPEVKSYDDIDALSGFLKKSRYKIIGETPLPEMICTCITHRCHHSACAYTNVPCSAYITDLRRHRHHKPKKESFFPRIEQNPETPKQKERPATLELIQGSEKHVITLPQNSPAGGKRYYVTFTIKGAPAFDGEDFADQSKDYFKHRHAKSV